MVQHISLVLDAKLKCLVHCLPRHDKLLVLVCNLILKYCTIKCIVVGFLYIIKYGKYLNLPDHWNYPPPTHTHTPTTLFILFIYFWFLLIMVFYFSISLLLFSPSVRFECFYYCCGSLARAWIWIKQMDTLLCCPGLLLFSLLSFHIGSWCFLYPLPGTWLNWLFCFFAICFFFLLSMDAQKCQKFGHTLSFQLEYLFLSSSALCVCINFFL